MSYYGSVLYNSGEEKVIRKVNAMKVMQVTPPHRAVNSKREVEGKQKILF